MNSHFDEEVWKDIPRYPGYQASSLGRIRTYNKTTYTQKHVVRHWKNRIMKFKPSASSRPNIPQGGGYRVSLWKDGKCKDYLVARLIATTFIEDLIDTDMTINHKDGNRLNNRVENLEWLSRADNIKYGFENGQYKTSKRCAVIIDGKRTEYRSLSEGSRAISNSNNILHHLKEKWNIQPSNGVYEFYL